MRDCQCDGTSGAAGYDLSVAQSAVLVSTWEVLGKNRFSYGYPCRMLWENCTSVGVSCGKMFIDIGVGVIDADYRGEVGVILFNFLR